MAKKKHKKKHSFQHKNAPSAVAAAAAAEPKTTGISPATSKPATMPNEWSEVRGDVRRSLVLSGVFIVVMIALGYFLDLSDFGKNLYNSIKL